MSNDPTEAARREMIATGQPGADLAEAVSTCRYCGKELYEFEGALFARYPDQGAASAICKSAPAGPDAEHPLYPSHAVQQTWTTEQLQQDFDVLGFRAPLVAVRRKSDGKRGTLEFKHSPRVYFDWQEATS
jgi:hypothetical protein